ncbi:MAG: XRE family transcriptional regulator [Chloroflexia bacterium]|nr:XRE family transcriptional regulator [Chloroflexia bacterium]
MPKTKKFADLVATAKRDPERRARIEAYTRAMEAAIELGDLRVQRGVTQQELASRLAVSQANVSRIEREEDVYLSTLRNYVAALGGELEVVARFPEGETVKIA